MVDPVVGLGLKYVVVPIVKSGVKKVYAGIVDRNNTQFLEARDEVIRDWVVELKQQAQRVEGELSALALLPGRVEELERLFSERAEDHEARAVHANYALQAVAGAS